MHTNVILTNKRCTHAQSNYTNTKLKAWFRCLLCHPVRKWSGPILHPRTHTGANTANAAADGHEVMIPQHIMQPSIAYDSKQLES